MLDLSSSTRQGGFRSNDLGEFNPVPLISIIIVVFRDCKELGEIVESILPFQSSALEIVVVDGFSQDGTVELLESLNERIAFWLSEPDTGIYDAMNKGLAAARGTYVLHLNAGDRLLNVPWAALKQLADEAIDVVCCRVLLDSRVVFVSSTSMLSKMDNTWHHQGTFYRRASHLRYDASYRMAADFDHNQRLLKQGCTIRELDVVVADHKGDGISMQMKGHGEIYRSVRANFGLFYLALSKTRFALMVIRSRVRGLIRSVRAALIAFAASN
jgi:glycosyltransferase involved in cell wall biosynthesis